MWLVLIAFMAIVALGLLITANVLVVLRAVAPRPGSVAATGLLTTGVTLTLLAYGGQCLVLGDPPHAGFVAALGGAVALDWSVHFYTVRRSARRLQAAYDWRPAD
jgi:hypothetical protein